MPAFSVGKRTLKVAGEMLRQLDTRCDGQSQIVPYAFRGYEPAMERCLGQAVDYTPSWRRNTATARPR